MQGFNMGRYVPPDQEGLMSGNQIHGKHALGARANKISQGILTVRFEMPYPIWCTHCPKPTIIGQGVRFNAEKKKVGNYYSTPIFSFRMKHVACSGWIEIRTDPKNTAYVVTEGARKRDLGEDKLEEGEVKILTEEERDALRNNAFATLEGKVEDKQKLIHAKRRLEELQDLSEQHWDDPYMQNKKLRNAFRIGRKQREKDAAVTSALQEKMSLGLDLLPEHDDDTRRARLIEFGGVEALEKSSDKAITKPLFQIAPGVKSKSKSQSTTAKRTRAEEISRQQTAALAASIRSNTRAVLDPFLPGSRALQLEVGRTGPKTLAGVKPKREEMTDETTTTTRPALVDYDSG